MCYKVEASFILIHLLKNHSQCTISEIVEKKYAIERRLRSVFIDASRTSILSSIALFPEIFELNDDVILRKATAHAFFEEPVIGYFDFGMDDSIKLEIKQLLENV